MVWECALRGRYGRAVQDVLSRAEAFVRQGRESVAEIAEYENSDIRTS